MIGIIPIRKGSNNQKLLIKNIIHVKYNLKCLNNTCIVDKGNNTPGTNRMTKGWVKNTFHYNTCIYVTL